ncbi:MAG: ThuA domain-containing protein [Verrucomicrobiota bacterium]|nr:ThuA domain-containing protein [Verrucomicrobiota bacterium]
MNALNVTIFTLFIGLASAFCFGDEEETKIKKAMPSAPSVQPDKIRKALVYSHASGFKHSSIPTGAKALRIMAQETGAFEATFTIKTDEFTEEGLSKYDLIIFNNCTHVQKAFTEDFQRTAILDFIKSGKAFVGFHSASDGGMPHWQEYTDMIGGCFAGHPWNAGGTWPFSIEDAKHPVNAAFKKKEFTFSDEIYQYKSYDRSKLRVLIGLDAIKSGKKGNSKTNDYPVSWVKSYGKGRIFYSNFGHNKATWWTPFMLQHFLDGIRWAVGDLNGPSESLPLKK